VRGSAGLVVFILALAAIFDALSGNPIHSILLFGAAVALTREEVRSARTPRADAGLVLRAPPTWVAVMTGLLLAVLVGEFGRYSWPATVAVMVLGAAGLFVAWQVPIRRDRPLRPVTLRGGVAWAALFVTLGLWELTQLLLQPTLTTDSYAHPTISVLSDPVLATHPGRSIALFVWLALGWFLVTA